MTTIFWDKIINFSNHIDEKFSKSAELISKTNEDNWYNSLYKNQKFRRAHVECLDKRLSHRIYILHSTVFPHFNDPSPIWGFDIVCGPNKVTGAFHDFSLPGYQEHYMSTWWTNETNKYQWNKNRALPDWARRIFSNSMVAAGNIQTVEELDKLLELAETSLNYYLDNVGITQESGADYHELQNYYCINQKKNPKVLDSMLAMGYDKNIVENFINRTLFPETYE
jgi:hypothetical protein